MRYLLYDKPPGVTSFDCLYPVKRAIGTGKVGHTGTLDKFASGLMIILAGRALKLSRFFSGCDKSYEATVCFGRETDTLDGEGATVAVAPPPGEAALAAALAAHRGVIDQTPPLYSAVHIDGRRAWEFARGVAGADGAAGEARLKSRRVTVYGLELRGPLRPADDDAEPGPAALADIAVRCSAGTYVRSLARDVARAAASRAYLRTLRRVAVAGFTVARAAPPDCADFAAAFAPVDRRCFETLGIPCIEVDAALARRMRDGQSAAFRALPDAASPRGLRAVFAGSRLAAVLETRAGRPAYGFVNGNEDT